MRRLSVAFFCSGFAALLCQIAWQRMLGIFAGSDTVSAALVVGAFLAGLGLGSIIGARIADRLSPRAALFAFAGCEALVAVFALLSKPFLYDLLAVGLAGVVDSNPAIFALCFAGLVLPTTLMGASLPLISRAVATSLDTVAERIGWLYGLNTLGAGLGALAGGWVLLGELGFVASLGVAAALDITATLLVLSLAPTLSRAAPASGPAGSAGPGATEAEGASLPLWCVLVFLSGYVIVALEILWVRVLGQVGQFHAYLFPTVLGVFLLADGLGMAVAARLVRRLHDPRPAFFLAQSGGFVLAAALLFGLWWALPQPPFANMLMPDQWRLGGHAFILSLMVVVAVVAPPSFLIGMTFPFVQRAVQRDLASVGARVGWVQLANILGNAAGSVVTGLVTLHLIGTAGTLLLIGVLSTLLALGWLWRARGTGLGGRGPALAAAAACAGALLLVPDNAALWRTNHGVAEGVDHAWGEDRSGVVVWRDDRIRRGGGERGPVFIMGHSQASIPFQPRHMTLGAVGPLLHPAPERVFIVGIGSAGTPWGAAAVPEVRELRAVELVAPVLDMLRQHAALRPEGAVASLLADPRVSLQAGDGRRALTRTPPGSWDVIQADAVLPQTSHSGMLYSREYMELVRSRLAPGGIAVQWAPSWAVVETFLSVFPHVVLLRPAEVLIGSDHPIEEAQARLLARLADPVIAARLAPGNPDRMAEVAAEISGEAIIWTPATPRGPAALTDMFPRDEFFLNNGVRETWGSAVPDALRPRRTALVPGG
jgi:predicted membrane-bound spermidine synthase